MSCNASSLAQLLPGWALRGLRSHARALGCDLTSWRGNSPQGRLRLGWGRLLEPERPTTVDKILLRRGAVLADHLQPPGIVPSGELFCLAWPLISPRRATPPGHAMSRYKCGMFAGR